MPQVGLINLHGEQVRYADIPKNFRREDWGCSLPFLMVLMRQKTYYQTFLTKYRAANPHKPIRLAPSVTQLLKPPRVAVLESLHEWFETPDRMVKREMGTLKHEVIERNVAALREMGEERYHAEVKGAWEIEPGVFVPLTADLIDLGPDPARYDQAILEDHKFSSEYKMKKAIKGGAMAWEIGGDLEDWTLQTNFYAAAFEDGALCIKEKDGEPTGELKRFRNAIRFKAIKLNLSQDQTRDLDNLRSFDVPRLPNHVVLDHFRDLYERHMAAQALAADWRAGRIDEEQFQTRLEACSSKDQWRKAPAYSVWKTGNQRATKTFYVDDGRLASDVEAEARKFLDECNAKAKGNEVYTMKFYPGEPKRCMDWCSVAGKCLQCKRESQGRNLEVWTTALERWRFEGAKNPSTQTAQESVA
jgi:hypothetical protein